MDFMQIFQWISIATSVIQTIQSGLSNDALATQIKAILPSNIYDEIIATASKIFAAVNPALQAVAVLQTSLPDKNKAAQAAMNLGKIALGVTLPDLVVDGAYGPKTAEMATALQQALVGKLGSSIKVPVDGWWGQLSNTALQLFMQAKAA